MKKLKTGKMYLLKRVSQRFVESCGFSPGTPVSTPKESWQGSLGFKKDWPSESFLIRPVQGFRPFTRGKY